MLHAARNRLAFTYLVIIMALSIGFSGIFYHQSTSANNNGLRRQAGQLGPNIFFSTPSAMERIRRDGQAEFNRNLLTRLILLNAGMLLAGAFTSLYLARRSLEPLEESMIAQSRFTSDAAHELRTPLTAMKTEIEVALRSGKISAAEAREILTSNLEEIEKLDSLTNALLRLARSQQQPDVGSLPVVEIDDSFKAALARIDDQSQERKIRLDVPEAIPFKVHGDVGQLTELFVVLLDNAIKYSPEKSTITVKATKSGDSIAIEIKDKGIGIKPEDLPHIFERFYRADQSRNKNIASGYGLGLSLAESIMKAHDGVIKVASNPGKGTTFILEFPAA